MSLFYSGSKSFTDETEKRRKEQEQQQEQIKQQVQSTPAPQNPAKSAPTVQQQYSSQKKKSSSSSSSSSSAKSRLSEGNGPVRQKPMTIADLPINKLAQNRSRIGNSTTRAAFMPRNTRFQGAGTEIFRDTDRAIETSRNSGRSYRSLNPMRTLISEITSGNNRETKRQSTADRNSQANRARESLYRNDRGVDFYNDYQLRSSTNRSYNPFAAQFDRARNSRPETWGSSDKTESRYAPGRQQSESEYTPGRPEYYRFVKDPDLIESGELTEEAAAYIQKGKNAADSPIDTDRGNISFTYENPFISMSGQAFDPDAGKTEHTVKAKDYMTEEELDIYYYIQGRYGTASAGRYLYDLAPELEERALAQSEELANWRERAEEHPILTAAAMAPMALTGGMRDSRYDIANAISEGISQNDSALARMAGNVVQGVAENVPNMILEAAGVPGRIASAVYGASDMAAEQRRAMEREGTLGEQGSTAKLILSAVIGGAEWGALSKAAQAPLRSITKRMTKNALSDTLATVAGSFLAGAGVGAAQSSLMTIADNITMGDNSAYDRAVAAYKESGMTDEDARAQAARDTVEAIASAALTGGVTGTAMSLPGAVSNGIEYRARGRALVEQGRFNEVLNDGLRLGEDTDAYANAEKLRNKLKSGAEVTDDEIGAQDVLNRVEAARQAQYVSAYSSLTGQRITEADTPEGVNAYQQGGNIYLTSDPDDAVPSIVRHEGAHGIEWAAPSRYSEYTAQLRRSQNYDAAVDRVRKRYDDLGIKYDDSVLESEVAADFARNFLTDIRDVERLSRAAQGNTRLIDRVYNGLRTLEAKMKAKGGRVFTDENTGLRVTYDELNTMRKRFESALLEARETGYNDNSVMYSVKRNYDSAKYGVDIDSRVTDFVNNIGVNRKLFTAADKSEIKELVRDAYRLYDEGRNDEAVRVLRSAGDILRTKDPRSYDGENLSADFEEAFSELYEEGRENSRARQQAARARADKRDYNVSAAGMVRDTERREGASLTPEERESFAGDMRSAFDALKSGDEAGARERLMSLSETIAERAQVRNPAFGDNEAEILRAINSLRLNYGELKTSPDANQRELYDRLRRITRSANEGSRIDQVYGELESRFGKNYFDTETETNQADMLERVADVYETLRRNEYMPSYGAEELEGAAGAIADSFITEFKRQQPAAANTPAETRESDLRRYGADIEQPFRDIEFRGATEGDIADLSNVVRDRLDKMVGAMKQSADGDMSESVVNSFDEFAANFNDIFARVTRNMDMDDDEKNTAAQLILSGVCDPADNIVNAYMANARDLEALAKTGMPRADGSTVTPEEAEKARSNMKQYRKLQKSIEGLKPSRYYTNSGQKPFFTPETQAEMRAREDEFYYKGITNKATYDKAKRYVKDKGVNRTLSELSAKEDWSAEDHARALALIAHYQSKGDHRGAVDVVSMQRQHYTRSGQAVQSARMIEKLTPEGRFIDTMRQAEGYENKQIERRGNAEIIKNRLKNAREQDRERASRSRQEYNENLREQDTASKELKRTDSDIDRLQKRSEETKKKRSEAQERLDETQSEYDKANAEYEKLRNEKQELDKKIKSLEGRTETKRKQAEKLREAMPDIEKAESEQRRKYDKANAEYEKLRDRMNDLKSQLSSLEGRIETKHKQIEKYRKDISELEQDVRSYTENYRVLKSELDPLIEQRREIRKQLISILQKRKRLIERSKKAGERLHSAVDEVLDSEGIKHVPEYIKEYVHAAFAWIENLDNVDNMIDLVIIPTSKTRKTASGNAIKRSLRKAAKKSGGLELMKGIAINQLYGLIEDYTPKSLSSKLSTVHAAGMLLNTTTILRNIASNAIFSPFETVSNEIAVLSDLIMSAFTGNRSVTLENPFRGWTTGRRRMRLSRLETALGITGIIDTDSPYLSKHRNFVPNSSHAPVNVLSRIGGYTERGLGYALTMTDEWQKGFAEGQIQRSLERAQRASGKRNRNRDLVSEADGTVSYTNDPGRLRRLLQAATSLTDKEIKEITKIITDSKRSRGTKRENNVTVDDILDAVRTYSERNDKPVDENVLSRYKKSITDLSPDEAQEIMKPRTMFSDEDIAEVVNEEIRYRTFQDDTLLARILNAGKKTFNEAGVPEFGLGDFIIKFTTVPGNIMTRSLEYSPLGYVKALWLIGKTTYDNVRNKKPFTAAQQREIALSLSRPFTSLGLIAAGAFLRHNGIIVGTSFTSGEDYRENKWEKGKGLSDFVLNLSALQRMIKGEDTAARDGDTLFDVGWVQPINSTFSLGAGLYDSLGSGFLEKMGLAGGSLQDEEGFEKAMRAPGVYAGAAWEYGKENFDEIFRTLLNYAVDQAQDISALQSIYNIQQNWKNADGEISMFAIATAADFGLSFVPQMVKKVGNVLDTSTRNPYKGETLKDTAIDKIKAALPYMPWREEVPKSVDVFGDEISSTRGSTWKDIINEYILPGRLSRYKKTSITDELDRLKEYSTDVLPKTPYQENSVIIDDQKYTFELYGKDYEEYSKLLGQTQTSWLDEMIHSDYYKYLSENEKVDLISELVSTAEKSVKKYWVAKEGKADEATLEGILNEEKEDLMSEPAMAIKRKQAKNYIQQPGVKIEDYMDVYLQVPYNQLQSDMEERIADYEKRISRTRAGTQYKTVNGKRVYSRNWTQAERDEFIAECQEAIEGYKNGTKKKRVDITGEWKDLTPEQQEKVLWFIDEHVDEIELPEEAISTIPDESGKSYEESGGAININEVEDFTFPGFEDSGSGSTVTASAAGIGSGSSGGSSGGSGSGSGRSSGRTYARRSGGRSGGRSRGSGGGGISLARFIPSSGAAGAARNTGYTYAPDYGFSSPDLGGRSSYADLEPIYTALELNRFVPQLGQTDRFIDPVTDIERFVPLFNA